MSQIYVGCELEYATSCATTFLFQVNVSQTEHQKIVSESLSLNRPNRAQGLELGLQHNRAQRCFVQSGSLVVHYEATVDLTAEVDFANDLVEQNYLEIPADALPYLNPSRYCESDLLGNFALSQFGAMPHGLVRVRTICDWVFNNLTYVSDSTDSQTTAQDVFVQRQGVCRDYAHLSIALCRALGIPARYVCGYAVNLSKHSWETVGICLMQLEWLRLAASFGSLRVTMPQMSHSQRSLAQHSLYPRKCGQIGRKVPSHPGHCPIKPLSQQFREASCLFDPGSTPIAIAVGVMNFGKCYLAIPTPLVPQGVPPISKPIFCRRRNAAHLAATTLQDDENVE